MSALSTTAAGVQGDAPTLQQDALWVRQTLLRLHYRAQSSHLGSSLSAVDILVYLYRHFLRATGAPEGDIFILSKGHGASALYATLERMGLLAPELLDTYYQDGTLLAAHPTARAHQQIPVATGSLGHGLSMAAGLAYAACHIHRRPQRICCLLSDGECNEGSVWEAAAFAAQHQLHALTAVIDANGLQGFGRTSAVMDLNLPRLFTAFGWQTCAIDGHCFNALATAFNAPHNGPRCIIARTIKGKGISFLEDQLAAHYVPPSAAQYPQALAELFGAQPSDAH